MKRKKVRVKEVKLPRLESQANPSPNLSPNLKKKRKKVRVKEVKLPRLESQANPSSSLNLFLSLL